MTRKKMNVLNRKNNSIIYMKSVTAIKKKYIKSQIKILMSVIGY